MGRDSSKQTNNPQQGEDKPLKKLRFVSHDEKQEKFVRMMNFYN